jgi:hypothetical protein
MTGVGESETTGKTEPYAAAAAGAVSKVFISFASQDLVIAERLCGALEAAGLPCWIAQRDVHAGESYAAAIVLAGDTLATGFRVAMSITNRYLTSLLRKIKKFSGYGRTCSIVSSIGVVRWVSSVMRCSFFRFPLTTLLVVFLIGKSRSLRGTDCRP